MGMIGMEEDKPSELGLPAVRRRVEQRGRMLLLDNAAMSPSGRTNSGQPCIRQPVIGAALLLLGTVFLGGILLVAPSRHNDEGARI